MPSSDWRSPAAYAHAKSIPAAGFAWEYLRRDEDYRRDFRRVSACSTNEQNTLSAFSERWGLRFPGRSGSISRFRPGVLATGANQTPDKRTVSPDRVAAPASANVLQAGAVIAAALITGIRSDLPGQITAHVTENIYDSPTGKILLIPQGTRVIGQYDNGVGFGQKRILLVWNRLIFPNGRSIMLERQSGADAEGYAGLEDGVNYHWGELFKAAVLSTLLSVGAQARSSGNDSDIVQELRQGASQSISQTGQQVVSRQLNIAPTLTIRPGFPVRVIVTRDLVLEPYGG